MSGPYEIRVYDNFHYMDRDESYLLGPFATAQEAIRKARSIVRDFLADAVGEHRTVEQLLRHYRSFGVDPAILGEPEVAFSAWDYAESIAAEYGISSTATTSPDAGASAIPEYECGVPLRQIAEVLASAGHAVHGIARGLQFEDEIGFRTSITVEGPRTQDGQDFGVASVTRVITQAPQTVAQLLRSPEGIALANQMAALGSLKVSRIAVLESRLSVYDKEDAWNLHGPLLVQAALQGRATFAAIVNAAAAVAPIPAGPSRWSRRDLEQVRQALPGDVFARLSDTCLTLVVPLPRGDLPAHIHLRCDAPHPTLGSGLLCLIEAPARSEAANLTDTISRANEFELSYEDEPPHFGAWCRGATDNSVAYHQFLPNALHDVPGIAVNISAWAIARAQARYHYY